MADICEELRKQLHELNVLRESCVSALVREGMESDAAKKTIEEFDTLAEELRDAVALYKQPFDKRLNGIERKIKKKENLTKWECWVLLNGIERKIKKKENLTKWECRVLYGIDWYSEGDEGKEYFRRKNIEERRSDKEKKQDLALAFDTTPDRISVTEKEALSGNIQYHYNILNLNRYTSTEGLILPEEIGGHLDLNRFTFMEGFTLPKKVGGNLYLRRLISAKRFMLPERIRGGLYLPRLTTIQGITRWPSKLLILEINRALPQEEKEELKKRYPGKISYVDS